MLKSKVRAPAVVFTALLMQMGASAWAQTDVQGQTETQADSDEIVVTAMRRSESLQDVSASITALTGERIEELGLTNSQDLAAQIPGLNIMGPFGQSSPQISVRGVGNNGFSANSVSTVGVYSDEVYLNQSIGHGFQLFDLARVELLRGPQGTLYGANATSGALNYISRRPGQEASLEGSGSYGDYGQLKFEGAGNLPLTDDLALRVAAASNSSDGYRRNTFLGTDAGFVDDFAWRALLSYAPGAQFDALLKLHGGRARNDGAQYEQQGVIDPLTFGFCDNARIAAGECMDFFGNFESRDVYSAASDLAGHEDIDVFGATATANWDLGPVRLTSITAYEETDRDTQDELDGSPTDQFHDQIVSTAHQFSQEMRLTSDTEGALSWIVGAFYFKENADEFEPLPARAFGPGGLSGASANLEGVYRYFVSQTESVSAFGDARLELGGGLALLGGLRVTHESMDVDYEAAIFNADGTNAATQFTLADARVRTLFPTIDRVESQEWDVATGRLVLEYKLNPDILIYGSVARGFRGGNFNSGALFADAEFTLVDPEFVDAFELGLHSTFMRGAVTFNASVFAYDYTDQQVTTVIGGQQLLANAASSSILGGEAELTLRPSRDWLISLGASLLDATYDEFISPTGADLSGNDLENAPNLTFNGLISYTQHAFGDHELVWATDFSYKGDHYLDFSNNVLSQQEGFWLHNASLTFQPSDGHYRISVWGRNLWDEEYRVNWADLSGFGFNLNTYGAPRVVGVTLGFAYN
jgi:iron complex outermembrane receptor protein